MFYIIYNLRRGEEHIVVLLAISSDKGLKGNHLKLSRQSL